MCHRFYLTRVNRGSVSTCAKAITSLQSWQFITCFAVLCINARAILSALARNYSVYSRRREEKTARASLSSDRDSLCPRRTSARVYIPRSNLHAYGFHNEIFIDREPLFNAIYVRARSALLCTARQRDIFIFARRRRKKRAKQRKIVRRKAVEKSAGCAAAHGHLPPTPVLPFFFFLSFFFPFYRVSIYFSPCRLSRGERTRAIKFLVATNPLISFRATAAIHLRSRIIFDFVLATARYIISLTCLEHRSLSRDNERGLCPLLLVDERLKHGLRSLPHITRM